MPHLPRVCFFSMKTQPQMLKESHAFMKSARSAPFPVTPSPPPACRAASTLRSKANSIHGRQEPAWARKPEKTKAGSSHHPCLLGYSASHCGGTQKVSGKEWGLWRPPPPTQGAPCGSSQGRANTKEQQCHRLFKRPDERKGAGRDFGASGADHEEWGVIGPETRASPSSAGKCHGRYDFFNKWEIAQNKVSFRAHWEGQQIAEVAFSEREGKINSAWCTTKSWTSDLPTSLGRRPKMHRGPLTSNTLLCAAQEASRSFKEQDNGRVKAWTSDCKWKWAPATRFEKSDFLSDPCWTWALI